MQLDCVTVELSCKMQHRYTKNTPSWETATFHGVVIHDTNKPCGLLRRVDRWTVTDVSKDRSAFICRVKQSKTMEALRLFEKITIYQSIQRSRRLVPSDFRKRGKENPAPKETLITFNVVQICALCWLFILRRNNIKKMPRSASYVRLRFWGRLSWQQVFCGSP
jgi:ribosomal protein L30/L7E